MARSKGFENAKGVYISAPKREEYKRYLKRAQAKTRKIIAELPEKEYQKLKDRHPSEINWLYRTKENRINDVASIKGFERELKRLKQFTSGKYLRKLKIGLQNNYITALRHNYEKFMGKRAFNELVTLVRKVPVNQFAGVVDEEKMPIIDNYYTKDKGLVIETIEKIRKTLNMPEDRLPEALKAYIHTP